MTNEQVPAENQQQPKRAKTEKDSQTSGPTKRVRLRMLPIWLRLILIILLLVAVAVIGLMIGYAVLGDGNALDVLKWKTWQHILDIMNGVEE